MPVCRLRHILRQLKFKPDKCRLDQWSGMDEGLIKSGPIFLEIFFTVFIDKMWRRLYLCRPI
jgi:hypothetical protein